ncbi:hypothetical protein HNP25_003167 [Arcicella rosea]|uniref:Uncharacterized protein n=1 Tax=Arcicella rosea TaxID=502909 RepID=A0A841EQF0_9BACT|nr:hypothetical protein [Arcicella rosea]
MIEKAFFYQAYHNTFFGNAYKSILIFISISKPQF